MKEKGLRGIIKWGEKQGEEVIGYHDDSDPVWQEMMGKLKELEKQITATKVLSENHEMGGRSKFAEGVISVCNDILGLEVKKQKYDDVCW